MFENVIFTICSKNYLAQAITLGQSVQKHVTNCEFLIFICDLLEKKEDLFIVQKTRSAGIRVQTIYDLRNYIPFNNLEEMAAKYTILEMNTAVKPFVLESLIIRGFKKIIFLDPDILVLDNFDDLWHELSSSDIILTPHMLSDLPEDGKSPSNINILSAGIYNLGFIGITPDAMNMVKWWGKKLEKYCFMDVKNGMHVDQNWANFMPTHFEKTKIIRSTRHNIAYWNLHERVITNKNNKWYSDNNPISFFHFSGLEKKNIKSISKHQNRFTLNDFPQLDSLFKEYLEKIDHNMEGIFKNKTYFFGHLPGTTAPLSQDLRKSAVNFKENIFNPDQIEGFTSHVRHYVARDRRSMHDIFIDTNYDKYIDKKSFGVNLYGYFSACTGMGVSSRSMFQLMQTIGTPLTTTDIKIQSIDAFDLSSVPGLLATDAKNNIFDVNIISANADQTNNIIAAYGPHKFKNKYNIGIWFWELEDYFPFRNASDSLDEIWACSSFCAKIFRKYTKKPVIQIPFPFRPTWKKLTNPAHVRAKYGISSEDFVFFYAFDFYSSIERKNPNGVIDAFNMFSKPKTKLIIKTSNSKYFHKEAVRLKKLSNNRIIFIEENLSNDDMMSLVNATDCFLSLHRSEGLGLNIMEAMSLGKPVISTEYGGITDILRENNSYPVKYQKTPITQTFGPYQTGQLWADPDILHAVQRMNEIYENPTLAAIKCNQAKKDISKLLDASQTAVSARLLTFRK